MRLKSRDRYNCALRRKKSYFLEQSAAKQKTCQVKKHEDHNVTFACSRAIRESKALVARGERIVNLSALLH